jgi:hypothetical protein
MHIERALRVINLLDVPEHKRKFWPQNSLVVVQNQTHEVLDVIQVDSDVFAMSRKYGPLYPEAIMFCAQVGSIDTIAALEAAIAWHFEHHAKTYLVGYGMLPDASKPN